MKEIKMLAENIAEELEDAEKYAKCAVKHMETDRELMSAFSELSRQELAHADKLHTQAVRLINEQKSKGVVPPEAMMIVWEWEHEKMIRDKAKILAMLDMLKG